MSQLFMLPQLVHDQGRSGKTWLGFLRVRALSLLLHLRPSSTS